MTEITINGITLDHEDIEPMVNLQGEQDVESRGFEDRSALTSIREEVEVSRFAAPVPAVDLPVSAAPTYLLIHTASPITKDQRSQLVNLNLELLEYVMPNTFMTRRSDATTLEQIRALDFVVWVVPYARQFKVHAHLVEAMQGGQTTSNEANEAAYFSIGQPAALTSDTNSSNEVPYQVDVLLHQGISGEYAAADVAAVAGVPHTELDVCTGKIRLSVTQAQIEQLTHLESVRHIELVPKATLSDDVAIRIVAADIAHLTICRSGGALDGSGQVVAVADTGFDRGSMSDVHPAFTNRVKRLYPLGRIDRANDPHGHGTHVAGSIAGDGVTSGGDRIIGAAPAAQLVVQSLMDSVNELGGIPSDLADLFRPPYTEDGARVHNNSWTLDASTKGIYVSAARELDDFVWKHRDLIVCVAAGNHSRDSSFKGVVDPGSVEAPGTAKNCITVGASESLRLDQSKTWAEGFPDRFPIPPIGSDLWANSADGLAAFSGRGPTKDGRIKPDLVAPGTSILSALSRDVLNPDSFWGESHDSLYCYRGGTSMATPIVSGCAAVVRQYLINERGINQPSAALVKAMLLNGAVFLPGHYNPSESGARPSFNQGFGRVNLARTLGLVVGEVIELHDEGKVLEDTGEEQSFSFVIPPKTRSIAVTLVWTDLPGERLVHDLDLIVRVGDLEHHGNMPVGSSDFDRVNNVEEVLWLAPPIGNATAVVRAYNVALTPQNFALVIRVSAIAPLS